MANTWLITYVIEWLIDSCDVGSWLESVSTAAPTLTSTTRRHFAQKQTKLVKQVVAIWSRQTMCLMINEPNSHVSWGSMKYLVAVQIRLYNHQPIDHDGIYIVYIFHHLVCSSPHRCHQLIAVHFNLFVLHSCRYVLSSALIVSRPAVITAVS